MRSSGPHHHSPAAAVVGGVMAIIFGIFWLFQAMRMGAPAIFPLFGVFFIIIALLQIGRSLARSKPDSDERHVRHTRTWDRSPPPRSPPSRPTPPRPPIHRTQECAYCGRHLYERGACPGCGATERRPHRPFPVDPPSRRGTLL